MDTKNIMKYNIHKTSGPPEKILIKLNDNILDFFDYGGCDDRNESIIKLIINAFKVNEVIFENASFNVIINTGDRPIRNEVGTCYIDDISNTIPCWSFDHWRVCGISSFTDTVLKIQSESIKKPIYDKVFWTGCINPHIRPRILYEQLSSSNSDLICNSVDKYIWQEDGTVTYKDFTALPDHCKYKYLIDIQGMGYSGRLKFLLFTRRVVFIVDRVYKEFWHDGLIDGENCIMIKNDLSNLQEKLNMVRNDNKLYEYISTNAYNFAINTFTEEIINKQITDVFKLKI